MSRMRAILRKSETPGWDKATPAGARLGRVHPDVRPNSIENSPSTRFAEGEQDGTAKPKPPASTFGTSAYWASLALSPAGRAKEPSPWGRSANAPGAPKSYAVPRPNPAPTFPAAATFVAARTEPATRPETEKEVSRDVASPNLPESHPYLSRFSRALRKLRRWVGLSVGRIPARCSGNARTGMPCRAPAMDNGFCRMHGGKRTESILHQLKY